MTEAGTHRWIGVSLDPIASPSHSPAPGESTDTTTSVDMAAHVHADALLICEDEASDACVSMESAACYDACGGGRGGGFESPLAAHAYVSCADKTVYVSTPQGMSAITVPNSHKEVLASPYAEKWCAAEDEQYDTLASMGTWTEVPRASCPPGTRVHKCKWVYACKLNADGTLAKMKARLVFMGNGQAASTYSEVYANTVSYCSVRAIISVACLKDYELFNVDIRAAYLSAPMDHELYMAEPPGRETTDDQGRTGGTVLRLERALYGAKQSGKLFRNKLHGWLTESGFEQATHDDCVYILRAEGEEMALGCFVDDLIVSSSSTRLRQRFMQAISKAFDVDDRGDLEWALGMRVQQDRRRRTLTISSEARILALAEKNGLDMKKCTYDGWS